MARAARPTAMESVFVSLAEGLVSRSKAAKTVPGGGPERAGMSSWTTRSPASFAGLSPASAPRWE